MKPAASLVAVLALAGCGGSRWSLSEWAPADDPEWQVGQDDAHRTRVRSDSRLQIEGAVGGAMAGAVRFYQSTLRRALASDCRFLPSCSNYMIETISREGGLLGMLLGVDRVMRDHPFNSGLYADDGLYLLDPPGFRSRDPIRWTPLQDPAVPERLARRAREVHDRLRAASEEERRLFSFAAGFLQAGDRDHFFRAGTEFRRFVSYHPASPLAADAAVLAAVASLLSGRFREARDLLDGRDADPLAVLLRAYARFRREEFALAMADLRGLESGHPAWAIEARILIFLIQVVMKQDREAMETLAGLQKESPAERWASTRHAIESRSEQPSRSPALAGILSAVLPGTGQLYAGRPADGLVSFLLTGAFVWAGVEAFHEDLEVTGAVTGLVGLVFYASGIAGSAKAAHEYNDARDHEWFDAMIRSARGPEAIWAIDSLQPTAWPSFAAPR